MKKLITVLISIAMASGPVYLTSAQGVGDKAPSFSYTSTSGSTLELSDYEGKVLAIFLFGYGCPSCKLVGNDTQTKIYQEYSTHEDFRMIGLDAWNGSLSQVADFRESTGINYPLGLNAGEMQSLYKTSYDRMLVIDRDGIIAHKGGTVVSNDLNKVTMVLDNLLGGEATAINPEHTDFTFGDIYPNPVDEQLTIALTAENTVNVLVYNSVGKVVIRTHYLPARQQGAVNLNVGNLPEGYYLVKLQNGNQSRVKKFLIRR